MITMTHTNSTLIELSQAQIQNAIRRNPNFGGDADWLVTEEELEDLFNGYLDNDFEDTVRKVWSALAQGPLEDTHEVHLEYDNDDGLISYAELTVSLPWKGHLSAGYTEVRHLTTDREATGLAGLMAIAEALIQLANESLTLARPLIKIERCKQEHPSNN